MRPTIQAALLAIALLSSPAFGDCPAAETAGRGFDHNVKVETFRFDADGKLLESDLFSLSRV